MSSSFRAPRCIVFRGAGYDLYVPPPVLNNPVPTVQVPRVRDAATLSDEETKLLDELVKMEAESEGEENWRDAKANSKVVDEYVLFRTEAERALENYEALKGWLAEGYDVSNLTDEDGIYAILMTLRGEGVGIWDGRWDAFFKDAAYIKEVEKLLKNNLSGFADITGGGSLNDAIREAASPHVESLGDDGDRYAIYHGALYREAKDKKKEKIEKQLWKQYKEKQQKSKDLIKRYNRLIKIRKKTTDVKLKGQMNTELAKIDMKGVDDPKNWSTIDHQLTALEQAAGTFSVRLDAKKVYPIWEKLYDAAVVRDDMVNDELKKLSTYHAEELKNLFVEEARKSAHPDVKAVGDFLYTLKGAEKLFLYTPPKFSSQSFFEPGSKQSKDAMERVIKYIHSITA